MGGSDSSSEGSPSAASWSQTPQHERTLAWVVLALAALVLGVGVPQFPVLLHLHSPQGYEAGEDSPSVQALAELQASFPNFAEGMASPVVLLLRATDGRDSVLTGDVANFSRRIREAVQNDPRVAALAPLTLGYYAGADVGGLHAPKLFRQAAFVSRNGKATLLVLVATKAPTMAVFEHDGKNKTVYAPWLFRKRLMEFLLEFTAEPPDGTEALLSGNPVIAYERVFDKSVERLTRAEIVVLPLAALIFIWLVGEPALLLLPPVVLLVSSASAVAAAVPLARRSPLSPDVPAAMVSVVMACSLDYSLFMLTRFNENRLHGCTLQRNVGILVRCTGKTIAVSGLLIAIAFFGAALVPEHNLQTAGIVLGLSTLACTLANVTLLPALLLLLGERLLGLSCRRVHSREPKHSSPPPGEEEEQEGCSSDEREVTPRPGPAGACGWLWLMRHVERRPVLAVATVFVAMLPAMAQLPKLRTTADSYAVLPRDMPSVVALRALARLFPAGRFDPYAVVLTADSAKGTAQPASHSNPLLTREGYKEMLQLCDALKGAGGVDSILGPPMIMTQRVDWAKAQAWRSPNASKAIHQLYGGVLRTHVNGSAVLLQLHTDFLPRGPHAAQWVSRVRRVLEVWAATHHGHTASLSGAATLAADAREAAMGAMPRYLAASTAAIMAVVLGTFKSVLLPLRLAFVLFFTLIATFGVAIVVYQTPLLHRVWPWLADYDGLSYEAVPLASALAVALGLDYDVFLVSRIVEYRQQGCSDSSSITQGVTSTGSIISGAGAIMALAFSGLFWSDKLLLQQLGLLLVTSVLLDAFVVRTVLVPAIMFSAGPLNWWPRRMPEPLCDVDDEHQDSGPDDSECSLDSSSR